MGNALKFTTEGSVTITVAPTDRADLLHFSVADTGIGIAPDKLESIFQSFEQADTSYARQYGGTGLGLAISRQLAQMMGGSMWVESMEQLGSTFHFTLHLKPWTGQLPEAAVNGGQNCTVRNLSLLVVDDNEVNRDVASMMLEKDHRVTTAANGIEALELLAEQRFDVVLMDVQMPLMDGLATTALIRSLERGLPALDRDLPQTLRDSLRERLADGHVPIVAMTAHAMDGDREMCLASGMDSYITKPFQPARLNEMFLSLAEKDPSLAADAQQDEENGAATRAQTRPSAPTLAQVTDHLQQATSLNPNQIERVLDAACLGIRDNLTKAGEALAAADHAALGRFAHTLKGTLLQCGLGDLAQAAEEIHQAARTGSDLDYGGRLTQLQQMLTELTGQSQQNGQTSGGDHGTTR